MAKVRSLEDSNAEFKERLLFLEIVTKRHLDAELGTFSQKVMKMVLSWRFTTFRWVTWISVRVCVRSCVHAHACVCARARVSV